jgi:hypothetical protein
MSLIITSNVQDEYASYDAIDPSKKINQGTPIQAPNFYCNHLKDPIKIPPHSEIAVQSIKIQRRQVFDIKPGNRFHFYLGFPMLDATGVGVVAIQDTLNIAVPMQLDPGTYTSNEVMQKIQDALNEAITHPTWWQKTTLTDLNVDGKWTGWTYNFKSHTKPSGNNAHSLINWRGWDSRSAENPTAGQWGMVHDAVAKTTAYTREKATGHSVETAVVCLTAPMDLTSGSLDIDLFWGAGTHPGRMGTQACGIQLSRPKLRQSNMPFFAGENLEPLIGYIGADYRDDIVPYGDYRIDWNERLDGSGKELILQQAVWDTTQEGTIMKEIEYWKGLPGGDNGGVNPVTSAITTADLIDNVANGVGTSGYLGDFYINFTGSGIRLYMRFWTYKAPADPGTFSWKLVCDTTLVANRVNHEYVWTPINQNKEALYLGLSAKTLNHVITIDGAVFNTDLTTGVNRYEYGTELDETTGADAVPGSSFWSQCRWGDGDGGSKIFNSGLAYDVEKRPNQRQESGSTINWTDLDANSETPNKDKVIVLQEPQNGSITKLGCYYPSRGANMGRQLGFPDWSHVSATHTGFGENQEQDGTVKAALRANWVVPAFDTPDLLSHTAFVKCPQLTAQSYNFCKSIPSQILYHIPRFTNDGKEYGNLFWEVPEKTYISLKNIDWLQMNQFDVQIVDKNEQLVQDLTGATTICFHLRTRL